MKRQPESTTEDLEDASDQEDRGDADDEDMKALGAVNKEPVITIGVDGETLDELEDGEESHVDDVKMPKRTVLRIRNWVVVRKSTPVGVTESEKELERVSPGQVRLNRHPR